MDAALVQEAIAPLVQLLRADGADLELTLVDPARDLVRVRVGLDRAGCRDCVLPPGELAAVIGDAVRRRTGAEFELEVDDPRGGVRRLVG